MSGQIQEYGDEYVDTSDPEEREMLAVSQSYFVDRSSEKFRLSSPRKRIKINHEVSFESPLSSLSSVVAKVLESSQSSPVHKKPPRSPGQRHPITPSARTHPSPSSSRATKNDRRRHTPSPRRISVLDTQTEITTLSMSIPLASSVQWTGCDNASQDPLNITTHHQRPRQSHEGRLRDEGDMLQTTASGSDSGTENSGILSTSPFQRVSSHTSPPSTRLSQSPSSLTFLDGPRLVQANAPPRERIRFSSLPPSSPLSSTSFNTENPARYLSPGTFQTPDPHVESLDANSPQPLTVTSTAWPDEIPSMRYSLRARQARQLNPYEYDKRLYKMQLRHIPDAMVKVVSPRRRNAEHEHRKTQVLPEPGGSQTQEWIPDPNEEDEESQNSMRPRRRRHSLPPNSPNNYNDEGQEALWLPQALNLSDDELPPLPPAPPQKEKPQEREVNHVRKIPRPRTLNKLLKFTTEKRRSNPESSPLRNPGNDLQSLSLHNEDSVPALHGYYDDFIHTDFSNDLPLSTHPIRNTANEAISVSSSSDGSESETQSGSPSQDQSDSRNKLLKRKMKVLGRMMPAVMIKKMLGKNSASRIQSRADSSPPSDGLSTDGDNHDESDNEILPGRSRIRRAEASHPVTQIKGDSESSDSEVDPVGSRGGSSIGALSDHGSGDDIEALGVSWFDKDCGRRYHKSRSPQRIKEDLIDRMLSRTTTRSNRSRGTTSARRKSKISGTSKQPRLDIVTRNAHTSYERQTKLKFPKARDSSSSKITGGVRGRAAVNLPSPDPPTDDDEVSDNHIQSVDPPKRRPISKKTRREEYIQRHLYVLPSDGKRLTINVQDSGFHDALAPVSPPLDTKRASRRHRHEHRRSSSLVMTNHPVEFTQDTLDDYFDQTSGKGQFGGGHPKHSWGHSEAQRDTARLSVDLEIPLLPTGLMFDPSTYLGQQLLPELLSLSSPNASVPVPLSYTAFGLCFQPTMDLSEVLETLSRLSQLLEEWLDSTAGGDNAELRRYENLLRTCASAVAWHFSGIGHDSGLNFKSAISEHLEDLMQCVRRHFEKEGLSRFKIWCILHVAWFCVELSHRLQCVMVSRNLGPLEQHTPCVELFLTCLCRCDLGKVLKHISQAAGPLDDSLTGVYLANFWIRIIHLASQSLGGLDQAEEHPFWKHIEKILQHESKRLPSDFEASEYVWRMMFSLCALSQFSPHGVSSVKPRLPACWGLTTFALQVIRLTSEVHIDQKLSAASLRKRDDYVRMVAARCFLLNYRWQWSLRGAYTMFNRLVEIFKSRKFANLLGEESDFPAFLRQSDLKLLSEAAKTDTTFTLFLKMVVQAAKDDGIPGSSDSQSMSRLRKLLSLTVPVSGVSFTANKPPTGQELSMLYNRFSAVFISIYLEPTTLNIRNRLIQARRYVSFPVADWKSKQACIRSVMNTAILLRHLELPLEECLKWLHEITTSLLDDYMGTDNHPKQARPNHVPELLPRSSKNQVTLLIQLLLGCVRRIIETPNMDPSSDSAAVYPDPALLDGPWVSRLFSMKELTSIVTTCLEIRKLVQSFLDARNKVMPPPSVRKFVARESQESQDEFGQFDLDWDDPDLIAALELAADEETPNPNKANDERVAGIMDEYIIPAIYRMVVKHFNDPSVNNIPKQLLEDHVQDAEKWVDCWAGCAAIIVQNGKKAWSHYLSLGPQSWERISDPAWRWRVGLRFMHKLLQLDPSAYQAYQDDFLKLMVQSLVTANVTFENEYLSLILSAGGLKHPMMNGVILEKPADGGEYHLSLSQFSELRLPILKCIVDNIAKQFQDAEEDYEGGEYLAQVWLDFIVTALSMMRDFMQILDANENEDYRTFSHDVFKVILTHPEVNRQSKLTELLTWDKSL